MKPPFRGVSKNFTTLSGIISTGRRKRDLFFSFVPPFPIKFIIFSGGHPLLDWGGGGEKPLILHKP